MKRTRKTVAAVTLALGLGLAAPSAAQAAPANPQPYAYGYLVALYRPPSDNGTYFCMDEYRQINGDGRPVVVKPCAGTWNQFWFWGNDGLIHSTNDGRCLWGRPAMGPWDNPTAAAVGCNAGDPHQRWTLDENKSLCNADSACLTTTEGRGPGDSYLLTTTWQGSGPPLNQQYGWSHSDSNTPIYPNA
ncbi:ricin-type beta-trefoil lectin domain protein [Kitasatospora aureofaciens]|uniref:ricin-type beta-trefoil lectin domain protein n=1 Tax=Kitasatospora aureofaciens TaxID=1894 RepID=UPI001C43BD5B|nr:ricin-type beta-trefoil lectin domain protein [Kitasatospora aureofaciens]MBV6699379.1 RICIN domain-containing protein [Kitasatospora aureofaciens]